MSSRRNRLVVIVLAVLLLSPIVYFVGEWAYNAGPLAPYICPNPNSSVYIQCRVFTQPGVAIISEDWQGHILSDLFLNGAPTGSKALWMYNDTIILTFPNSSSVSCDIMHSPYGPCFEGAW